MCQKVEKSDKISSDFDVEAQLTVNFGRNHEHPGMNINFSHQNEVINQDGQLYSRHIWMTPPNDSMHTGCKVSFPSQQLKSRIP